MKYIILGLFIAAAWCAWARADHEHGPSIKVAARMFEFTPGEITLKKGIPATLELTSSDVLHGIKCPQLGVRADMVPGKVTQVKIVPRKAGTFSCYCDVPCGSGHDYMTETITVKD